MSRKMRRTSKKQQDKIKLTQIEKRKNIIPFLRGRNDIWRHMLSSSVSSCSHYRGRQRRSRSLLLLHLHLPVLLLLLLKVELLLLLVLLLLKGKMGIKLLLSMIVSKLWVIQKGKMVFNHQRLMMIMMMMKWILWSEKVNLFTNKLRLMWKIFTKFCSKLLYDAV